MTDTLCDFDIARMDWCAELRASGAAIFRHQTAASNRVRPS